MKTNVFRFALACLVYSAVTLGLAPVTGSIIFALVILLYSFAGYLWGLNGWKISFFTLYPMSLSLSYFTQGVFQEFLFQVTVGNLVSCFIAFLVGYILEIKKVSEKRLLEIREKDKLISQSMHLSSLGSLTKSISSEFKQPLSEIERVLKTLASGAHKSPEWKSDNLEKSLKNIKNMNYVVEQITKYSENHSQLTRGKVDVHQVLQKTCERLSPILSQQSILLKINSLESENMFVLGNEIELENVFHNLISRSCEAFQETSQPGRFIEIQAQAQEGEIKVFLTDNSKAKRPEIVGKMWSPQVVRAITQKELDFNVCISQEILNEMGAECHAYLNKDVGNSFEIIFIPYDAAIKALEVSSENPRQASC